MAQRTILELVDDLDGGKADETVSFALDGVEYEIDLSADNAARLRDAFAEFVGHARRIGGRKKTGNLKAVPNTGNGKPDTQAVREWVVGRYAHVELNLMHARVCPAPRQARAEPGPALARWKDRLERFGHAAVQARAQRYDGRWHAGRAVGRGAQADVLARAGQQQARLAPTPAERLLLSTGVEAAYHTQVVEPQPEIRPRWRA